MGGLVIVLALAALAIFVLSERRLARAYSVPEDDVTIPTDADSVARGEYLATTVSHCRECHGADLGGTVFVDDPQRRSSRPT